MSESFLARARALREEMETSARPALRAVPPLVADPFDPPAHVGGGDGDSYARTALDNEAAAVIGAMAGTRNHTLNKAAYSLGQLVAGGELDESEVRFALTDAARLAGLAEHEIGPTITSGLSKGALSPRTAPPPAPTTVTFRAQATEDDEHTPEPQECGRTEDDMARALVAHHGTELRYCPQRGRWLVWNGHRWKWDDAEHHRELIRALARQLPDVDGWTRFRAGMLTAKGVTAIARLAQSDPELTIHVTQLDARPYELNTPGGIVDLRTGAITPPDPAALHTRCTTVTPDFERPSTVLDQFLADTFPDPELAAYIQRLLGVSLIGTVLEQVLPFAHGSGRNGKSTLMEAAMAALGLGEDGYSMAAPAEMLMVRKYSEHPAELAQMAGARLVVCSELEDDQRFAEAKVKQLTGSDAINARFMRANPFTFKPSHTLWLLGNPKPTARVGGPAFWRRIRLLPFTHVVPVERVDPRLPEKLNADAGALLAWIVRGAASYDSGGLRDPDVVRAATSQYESEQDTVARFVEDECHLLPGRPEMRAWRDELRTAYERWCSETGEEAVTPRAFATKIREMCGDDGRGKSAGRRYFTGIGLRSDSDHSEADDGR